MAEKREAVLSNYVPSRPTDILRRGLLSLFPDSMDQVSRQNAVDTLEKIANLSILPALGDLGYSATETAAKPSTRGAIDTLLQAALILPGAKSLHLPKSPSLTKAISTMDDMLAKSKFKAPVKLDAPTPVTNKTKMIDPLAQVPWEAEPGVFAYDNTGGESYLVDPFKTKAKNIEPTPENVDAFVTEQLAKQTKPPKSSSTVIGTPEWDELDTDFNADPYSPMNTEPDWKAKPALPPAAHAMSTPSFRAYHSSPHKFDKFQLEKIGTGEGTIMEGSGLYFSDDPIVRDFYRRQFTQKNYHNMSLDEQEALSALDSEDGNIAKTIHEISNYWETPNKHEILSALKAWEKMGIPDTIHKPATTYEVNINTDPSKLPQMDKALKDHDPSTFNSLMEAYFKSAEGSTANIGYPGKTQTFTELQNKMLAHQLNKKARPGTTLEGMDPHQSQLDNLFTWSGDEKALEKVKELVKKHGSLDDAFQAYTNGSNFKNMGEDPVYDTFLDNVGAAVDNGFGASHNKDNWKAAKEVSDLFKEQGIKGHKYLPSEGRYGDNNTRNYVIYDDKIIDIIKKYGLAGLVSSGLLGSLMSGADQPVQSQ
jgi:hypothetical protein